MRRFALGLLLGFFLSAGGTLTARPLPIAPSQILPLHVPADLAETWTAPDPASQFAWASEVAVPSGPLRLRVCGELQGQGSVIVHTGADESRVLVNNAVPLPFCMEAPLVNLGSWLLIFRVELVPNAGTTMELWRPNVQLLAP